MGADLSKVENLFLEWLLIDPVHGVSRFNPDPCIPAVAALHRRVADGDSVNPEEWDAAGDAAWAAGAAWAARAAAEAAARAAAGDAAAAQAQKFIELLAAAPAEAETGA